MEPIIEKFRTALGGFHRGDVMNYMDRLVTQHRSQMLVKEEALKVSQRRVAQLEAEIESLRQAHGSVSAEEARVRSSLEEATRSLTRLRGELSQTETKLAAARLELGRLHGQVHEMEPMAQKYDQLKDYVATVELDAHHKAQETVEEAKAKAREIQEDAQNWLTEVMDHYTTLRSEMDRVFQKIRDMSHMEGQFDWADEAAHKLQEQGGQQELQDQGEQHA